MYIIPCLGGDTKIAGLCTQDTNLDGDSKAWGNPAHTATPHPF